MAVTWIEPKTDWSATDRFNIEDYNRIKNNLEYLHEKAVELYLYFGIYSMNDIEDGYKAYWNADDFNAFERNLDLINQNIYTQDFGASQTFYPNGIFIGADELNRIESATISAKGILDNQKAGLKRIPFRFGQYKTIRV